MATKDLTLTANGASADIVLPKLPFFSELPPTGDHLFDQAIKVVFYHEGFYSNDPDDRGGATKFGVSLVWAKQLGVIEMDLDHDGDVDAKDIQLLTPAKAVDLYYRKWWVKYGYNRLQGAVAVKAFDLAVNMGAPQAHKLLQRAVRAYDGHVLADDGILGPASIKAINEAYQPSMLSAVRSEAAGFYRLLVAQNSKSAKFLGGWLNRAYF